MERIIQKCNETINFFEGGDRGVDEGTPRHILDAQSRVVKALDNLKTLAAEEAIENQISQGSR